MSQSNPILVTSAAGGTQGGTGNTLVQLLRAQGLPVRAFVRRLDERSQRLAALGAEVVVGDFLDYASVRQALEGVRRAYFAYPVREGLLDATAIFATAGREVGLEVTVNVSQGNASPQSASPRARQHWFSERVFDWAGVGAIHLRGGVFFENWLRAVAADVAAEGKMYLPLGRGDGTFPGIAGADVARAASALLTDPGENIGKTIRLIAPHTTMLEIATTMTRVLGRKVEYVEISLEQFRAALIAREGGANIDQIAHLSALWGKTLANLGQLPADADVVQQLTGRPAISIEEFIRERTPW